MSKAMQLKAKIKNLALKNHVPAGAAKVYLGNTSVNASQAFTTYFDNFKINSGLTTNRQ